MNVRTDGFVESHQSKIRLHRCWGCVHNRSSRHTEGSSSVQACLTRSNEGIELSSNLWVKTTIGASFFLMKETAGGHVQAGRAGDIPNRTEDLQPTLAGQRGRQHGASSEG